MKVKELIEALQKIDPECEVILQKDSEGNGYSPLEDIDDDAIYIANNDWSGDVYSLQWTAEEVDIDEDEWEDIKRSSPKCVVLFPIN